MDVMREQTEWKNWSGSVRCRPANGVAYPASEEEIAAEVRAAAERRGKVRLAGSGHSFMPLCASDDVVISLDRWHGVESASEEDLEATIRAGTKIHDMGKPLLDANVALENQGDVDVQSIAGALSTGTHGTGETLGNLSTQLIGVRLVTANGDVLDANVSDNADLLAAARVSLGMLGVFSVVRLRVTEAYRLHEMQWTESVDDCLAQLDRLIGEYRHFEFFWYPTDGLAHMKALRPTDLFCDRLPDVEGEQIDWSYRIFPTVRENRFNEMEYAIPAESGPECFQEVRHLMQTRFDHVRFPIEYRTLAADDSWLSPAYDRATVTLSIHRAADKPYEEFFRAAETIFRRYDGRPHWGKIHYLDATALRTLYPRWDAFVELRREMDPDGRFLNSSLADLFAA